MYTEEGYTLGNFQFGGASLSNECWLAEYANMYVYRYIDVHTHEEQSIFPTAR